jgi:uncharacterized protein YndB with AHSA1/START domain
MAEPLSAGATDEDFVISRTFDAPRDLVWKAFSDVEHLKHWWGPKGFIMKACTLDFRPGGIFHYCMQGPDGREMWGKFIYREIVPQERFSHIVSFSDANKGVTRHPLSPSWPLQTFAIASFTESGGKTTLTVRWRPYEATEEERKIFAESYVSMRNGWTGTMDQLDAYLLATRR